MRSPIGKLTIIVTGLMFTLPTSSQLVLEPVGDVAAIELANKRLDTEQTKQLGIQTTTATASHAIAKEFADMRSWQEKYNSYLKTASGFSDVLKAGSKICSQCTRLLLSFKQLKDAADSNHQGVVSSAVLTDLFFEASAELVTVIILIDKAVAKGDNESMLTGQERLSILWEMNDRLTSLNDKITRLALCVRYYDYLDVLNRATTGLAIRDNGEIAREAMREWSKRVAIPVR